MDWALMLTVVSPDLARRGTRSTGRLLIFSTWTSTPFSR
jgi:hypothetical protein